MFRPEDVRRAGGKTTPGEAFFAYAEKTEVATKPVDRLDSDAAIKTLSRLLNWFYLERERQSSNRMDMAMDHDFYDGLQWADEDAAVVEERGQMPLVYNEIAPMVDWIIGTERRTKVDWKVLPRAEDDVEMASIKTEVVKFASDVNHVNFARSRAFADAAKVGIGWVDDGARDDPTQDVIYSRYEDWRNVLWDSSAYEYDLSDARYVFRWRWVDEDIAIAMFPTRAAQIRRGVEEFSEFGSYPDEDQWYLGEQTSGHAERIGVVAGAGRGVTTEGRRRRVRLIECQWREPCSCKMVSEGPMRGAFLSPADQVLMQLVAQQGVSIIDRNMMRVHFAVFTEGDMLAMGPSIYRHNRFTLTPIWAYRRGRDRLPYGVVRRVADIQRDLNKRASKALFLLNTNQVIADEGATDDWERLRDEAGRPDGLIVKKPGKELTLRRDSEAASGQVQMMTLDAQAIQKTGGVNNENLGRQTNAVSGAAIEARQNQGAVGTTELFDNHRQAVQIQGEKLLSLVEQFYTEQKVIRITGATGKIEWLKANVPEIQPDGSVRWINDITASMSDFVVSEADYAGTLRQVMFDSLNQIASRLPPDVALRMLRIAFEFSDMPNKDAIQQAIREITGEKDPNKELSPEEADEAAAQMAEKAEMLQMQRQDAMLALEERRARVREINAKAAEIENRSGVDGEFGPEVRQVQAQAADQIDRLSAELQRAQSELTNRALQIKTDADSRREVANIDADAKIRVAELSAAADKRIAALSARLDQIAAGLRGQTDKPVLTEAP